MLYSFRIDPFSWARRKTSGVAHVDIIWVICIELHQVLNWVVLPAGITVKHIQNFNFTFALFAWSKALEVWNELITF
jgi:penicillin V acylase-like amidase (Ntn superfamily)